HQEPPPAGLTRPFHIRDPPTHRRRGDLPQPRCGRPPRRRSIGRTTRRVADRPPLHEPRRHPPQPAHHHHPRHRRQGGRRTTLRERIAVTEVERGGVLLHHLAGLGRRRCCTTGSAHTGLAPPSATPAGPCRT